MTMNVGTALTTVILMSAVAESAGGGVSITIVVPAGVLSRVRLGHPFRARYEIERVQRDSGREQRTVETGTWYVDAKGRVRREGDDDPAVQIDDPERNLSCLVHPRSRRVLVCHPLVGQSQPSDGEPPAAKAPSILSGSTEGLGSREIAGLTCNGELLKTELYVSEFWVSIELGQIVLLRQSHAAEDVTYRLFDISLGDPDPQLFVIPEI